MSNLGIDGLEDVEQIGTGGSSRVYRARQADLDRIVAVKVLNLGHDQNVSKRFDRERKAMGRLSLHEGIVPVYSSGMTTHGEPYLVMPYYANGSLQDQIDAGPMEWQTAVSYVDVAAETIAAAHDEGVVHLDLKPANILLTNHGAPRIADFGIAKLTTGQG
ncbi:MAG: serine/threonine-protein kinase, partial [Acidimicrobiales bacterium]